MQPGDIKPSTEISFYSIRASDYCRIFPTLQAQPFLALSWGLRIPVYLEFVTTRVVFVIIHHSLRVKVIS